MWTAWVHRRWIEWAGRCIWWSDRSAAIFRVCLFVQNRLHGAWFCGSVVSISPWSRKNKNGKFIQPSSFHPHLTLNWFLSLIESNTGYTYTSVLEFIPYQWTLNVWLKVDSSFSCVCTDGSDNWVGCVCVCVCVVCAYIVHHRHFVCAWSRAWWPARAYHQTVYLPSHPCEL